MRAYALFAAAVAAGFLALFGLAHALDVPVLSEETPSLGAAGAGAALAALALLVGDVVLPVPASGVMVVNGILFGAAAGAALSVVGSLGAAALGWWLGRRGGPLLARVVPGAERERAAALIARRGTFAVVLSRPVPVIAETVAIVAGAAGMPLRRLLGAALLGSLPPAVAYAVAGAATGRADAAVPVFVAVVALSVVVWLAGRRHERGAHEVP